MIKFICKDMENKVSKMKFVSGSVKFVVQPLCSAITPSNKLTGQLAFVADLPRFEVRLLDFSQFLSTDGILFYVSDLQKLVKFCHTVSSDVLVESKAKNFHHYNSHGMLSGMVQWFSNSWTKF